MHIEIKNLLEEANAHPFLFVGSGFTHRYLHTEDWKGLVSYFAEQAKPDIDYAYEWYRNEVSGTSQDNEPDLPSITERVEIDYSRNFLSDAAFSELRDQYKEQIHRGVSPLKIGVAAHLSKLNADFLTPQHHEEISAIGHARKNVAGIISTNFDRFLEHLFPEHVPYIGQNQLLFSPSYGVGEIYKIHGCVSDPQSLILTRRDYETYRSRNAYLSAKLMTIFLEHPIIFIGYSLTDPNIRMIFNDISRCLTEDQLSTLASRLIFVQRSKEGRPEGIRTLHVSLDQGAIESTSVVLSDFGDLFKAIAALKSSYPPKILRKLKKDIYEMIKSTSPKEKIRVIGMDDSTEMEQVEYVMGVGVASELAGRGYSGLDVEELTKDLIYEETGLEAEQVVDVVLPKRGKQTSFNLPVFKYVSQVNPQNLHEDITAYINEISEKGIEKWITKSMRKAQGGKITPESLTQLCSEHDCTTAKGLQQVLQDLAFIPIDQIHLDEFRLILVKVWEDFNPLQDKSEQTLTSNFRKAVRIYDWLKYGHKKTPEAPKGEEAK